MRGWVGGWVDGEEVGLLVFGMIASDFRHRLCLHPLPLHTCPVLPPSTLPPAVRRRRGQPVPDDEPAQGPLALHPVRGLPRLQGEDAGLRGGKQGGQAGEGGKAGAGGRGRGESRGRDGLAGWKAEEGLPRHLRRRSQSMHCLPPCTPRPGCLPLTVPICLSPPLPPSAGVCGQPQQVAAGCGDPAQQPRQAAQVPRRLPQRQRWAGQAGSGRGEQAGREGWTEYWEGVVGGREGQAGRGEEAGIRWEGGKQAGRRDGVVKRVVVLVVWMDGQGGGLAGAGEQAAVEAPVRRPPTARVPLPVDTTPACPACPACLPALRCPALACR